MGFLNALKNFGISGWFNLVLRSAQLIVALVVVGLYSVDLNAATKADKYADGKWVSSPPDPKSGAVTSLPPEMVTLLTSEKVFAVTVGVLAAVTAILFSLANIFFAQRRMALSFVWEWLLTIMFAILSGIFGKMYVFEKVEMESAIQRMKTAVNVDFVSLILWFITASVGTYTYWKNSKRFTPRQEIPAGEWQGEGISKPAESYSGSMSSRGFRQHSLRSQR